MQSNRVAPQPWHDWLPVSVNDTYGDPFIPEQIDNTVAKLHDLMGHRAPIAIFTKAGYDAGVLRKCREVTENRQVVIFYSLTGLNEAGISFANRVAMIDALNEMWDNVVVFTRPIIRNRNDSPAVLDRLVEVAANRARLLVMGGLHDRYKNKNLGFSVETYLTERCDEAGIKCFHKTSCCAAFLHGVECWVHDLGLPINLDVAAQLGYQFGVHGNSVVLERATTGDLNFLRMLTRADVWAAELISNYNLLTIPTGEQKYESTSSWFAWSENIETCLDCDYCIIKQIEYLKKMRVKIGTHPREMIGVVRDSNVGVDFSSFSLTKLRPEWTEAHRYADVRVVKPCYTHRYSAGMQVSESGLEQPSMAVA